MLYQTRQNVATRLRDAGIEGAENEAEWLLCSLKGIARSQLWLNLWRTSLSEEEIFCLEKMVERRIKREPLQYIIGYESFWGRDFSVGQGCLVPRPETELLVEEALRYFSGGTFLDWGTGSGCIASTLLLERPLANGIAVDASPKALKWAWKNLKKYGLLQRCLLWHSRDIEDVPVPEKSLGLVISNPPYIPTSAIKGLMDEVALYEPQIALDGGHDGLFFYKKLMEKSPLWLSSGGHLVVEMGDDDQARYLAAYETIALRFVRLVKDLQGFYRIGVWCRV